MDDIRPVGARGVPSPNLEAFRREVEDWVAAQMAGTHFAWSAVWTTRDAPEEYAFRRALGRALGQKGWLFPTYDARYGGAGLTAAHQVVIEEALNQVGLRLSMVYYTLARIVAPCVLQFGSEEQRLALIPGMTQGEAVVWQVLTEPQSGSDIANCRTIAVRDGDAYVVTGQKVMVGSHHPPDFLWTLVCTDPAGLRHENLSWMYIPADLPGIDIRPMAMMMGIKNAIFFDGVRVPASCLIGGENNGWSVGHTELELEHGGAGTLAGDPLVRRLAEYCSRTARDGRPLIAEPRVRDLLADALIESHICDLFAARNFHRRLARDPHPYGGAQYRYVQRLLRLHNAERLQEIVGFASLEPDPAVDEDDDFEHLLRAGPGQLHGGGTLDTDRLVIARRMGIGRTTKEEAPATF